MQEAILKMVKMINCHEW